MDTNFSSKFCTIIIPLFCTGFVAYESFILQLLVKFQYSLAEIAVNVLHSVIEIIVKAADDALKKKEAGKKKESKWDKKDKGYTMFDAECSDEELVNAEKLVILLAKTVLDQLRTSLLIIFYVTVRFKQHLVEICAINIIC